MKPEKKLRKYAISILGLLSSIFFTGNFLILERLRPKMVSFEILTQAEESLISLIGMGWLLMSVFLVISFYALLKHLSFSGSKAAKNLVFLGLNAISFLLIFADLALISDIGKQYQQKLAQPEWSALYASNTFQLVIGLVLAHKHLSLKERGQINDKSQENASIAVHFMGSVCAGLGLLLVGLSLCLSGPIWMFKYHILFTTILVAIPYLMAVSWWFTSAFAKTYPFFSDRDQVVKILMLAAITLIASVLSPSFLYSMGFMKQGRMLSLVLLPFYGLLMLFFYSLWNLLKKRNSVFI